MLVVVAVLHRYAVCLEQKGGVPGDDAQGGIDAVKDAAILRKVKLGMPQMTRVVMRGVRAVDHAFPLCPEAVRDRSPVVSVPERCAQGTAETPTVGPGPGATA